ncbi:MAG: hypothetical protein ABFR63_06495 [Thermodesulfobacteriota bacterium]
MKVHKNKRSLTILLLLSVIPLLAACGGSTTGYSSVNYGVYSGYGYPYHRHRYYDDDLHIHVDQGVVRANRQHRQEIRPERWQNIQAPRSRAAGMGRPIRMGRGRRR